MYYDVQRNRLVAELYCVNKHSSLLSDYASGNCLINNAVVDNMKIMELRYGLISEERCNEIDSWKVQDPYGYGNKLSTHGNYWVANEDESILFCHAFMPRHDDREDKYEVFLFINKSEYYFVTYGYESVIDKKENGEMEERMKLEYRYLSEKRASEIDALGIIDPHGTKISINYRECVTNEDETIVFQQIYYAHFYNIDHDCDQYLLFYKGHRYILEIEDKWRKEIRDGGVFFYFKFVICTAIQNYADCPAEEVLSVLKDVLYEWGRHKGRELVFGMDIPMEIIYLGEKIYG